LALIFMACDFVNAFAEKFFDSPLPLTHALSHMTARRWVPSCMERMVRALNSFQSASVLSFLLLSWVGEDRRKR
jgi:hypothetical protein